MCNFLQFCMSVTHSLNSSTYLRLFGRQRNFVTFFVVKEKYSYHEVFQFFTAMIPPSEGLYETSLAFCTWETNCTSFESFIYWVNFSFFHFIRMAICCEKKICKKRFDDIMHIQDQTSQVIDKFNHCLGTFPLCRKQ